MLLGCSLPVVLVAMLGPLAPTGGTARSDSEPARFGQRPELGRAGDGAAPPRRGSERLGTEPARLGFGSRRLTSRSSADRNGLGSGGQRALGIAGAVVGTPRGERRGHAPGAENESGTATRNKQA
ncbi:hypothetical protein GCM10023324_15060 [Streptomyces youssoufiensis]